MKCEELRMDEIKNNSKELIELTNLPFFTVSATESGTVVLLGKQDGKEKAKVLKVCPLLDTDTKTVAVEPRFCRCGNVKTVEHNETFCKLYTFEDFVKVYDEHGLERRIEGDNITVYGAVGTTFFVIEVKNQKIKEQIRVRDTMGTLTDNDIEKPRARKRERER